MNNRRKVCALILALVMSTLGLTIEGQSQEGRPAKTALAGSWRITATPGPNRPPGVPETIELLATYDASGGFVIQDNDDPSSGHGSWEYAGHGRFNATHERFVFDPQRHLVAILHIRSKITLNFTNDEYTTEEVVEIRQFPSGVVLYSYTGSTSVGRRIRVDPIE